MSSQRLNYIVPVNPPRAREATVEKTLKKI